jgi:hypothetical protein
LRLKLFTAFTISLVLSISLLAQLNPAEWQTEGIKTNPAINTTLCQHVAPADETKTYHFVVSANVTAATFLEQIGVDGVQVIRAQAYIINAFVTFEGMKQIVTLAAGERIRLRTSAALTGLIQCSMYMDN